MDALEAFLAAAWGWWWILFTGAVFLMLDFGGNKIIPPLDLWLDKKLSPERRAPIFRSIAIVCLFVAIFLAFKGNYDELVALKQNIKNGVYSVPSANTKAEIESLKSQLAQLQSRHRAPLDGEVYHSLKTALSKLKPRQVGITYSGDDSYDLAMSLDKLFRDLGWPVPQPPGIDLLDTDTGIELWTSDQSDKEVLDVLNKNADLSATLMPIQKVAGPMVIYLGHPKPD